MNNAAAREISTVSARRDLPVLIVDKEGAIGPTLAKKIKGDYLTILVTSKELDSTKNLIVVSFKGKVPTIPDNTFSHIFLFCSTQLELKSTLPVYVKKAQQVRAKLIACLSIKQSKSELIQYIQNAYGYSVVIVYGEIFGQKWKEGNVVNSFLHQAKIQGRIDIPNSGLEKIYPVEFEELIEKIIETIFVTGKENGLYYIFPKTPLTTLAAARAIKNIHPQIAVDFKKSNLALSQYEIPPNGEYVFQGYSLEERIKRFDMSKEKAAGKRPPALKQAPNRRPLLLVVAVIMLILFMPLITTVSFLVLGGISLQMAKSTFTSGEVDNAKDMAQFARSAFSVAGETNESLLYLAKGIGLESTAVNLEKTINTGKSIAHTAESAMTTVVLYESVLSGKSTNPEKDFQSATNSMKQTLLLSQQMRAEEYLSKDMVSQIGEYEGLIELFGATVDMQAEAIGLKKRKTYLVLFQNNMELRPGGGFIGSYGLAKVEKGRVREFKISDVYDADGKLKEDISPPFPLRRYLGIKHLFLRDSNFDVDNNQNAKNAAAILSLETGEKVDGVIAVNVSLLKSLLEVMGPVYIPEYNQTATAENFYLLTQSHAEDNFFPGSTQKKDFLRSLYSAIEKAMQEKEVPYGKLLKLISNAVNQKDIVISLNDRRSQSILDAAKLSSAIKDSRSKNENAINDYLGIYEANIGANKANYYVKRSIRHAVALQEEGVISEELTLSYVNTSEKKSKFGGDYHNYIQLMVPQEAKVTEMVIDNKKQQIKEAITSPSVYEAKTFNQSEGIEIEERVQAGKKVVGFFIIIPTGLSKKIQIRYEIGGGNTIGTVMQYDLRLVKQSGSGADPYAFTFTHPDTLLPSSIIPPLVGLGKRIVYSGNYLHDTDFKIRLTKK